MVAPKLSLIFCCYNVSKYIDGIYKWLCSQSYNNIEIIFVEDCSTDDTKKKLFSVVHDPRMKIIENSRNLGLSESRNVGLKNATGDYIGFPDPDDMFDLCWLDEIANIIKYHSPKVIITGMREDYENGENIEYSKNILSEYSGVINNNFSKVLIDLEKSFLFGYMNNKFYNREFIIKNKFSCKNLSLKEDFEFNIHVFSLINDFYILNKPYYFYKKRRNGNTLTTKFVPDYFGIHLNSVLMLKRLLESKGNLSSDAVSLLVKRFFRYLLSAIERNTNKQANLSFYKQKIWIKEVIEFDNNVKWFLDNCNVLNYPLKFLAILIKMKSYNTIVFLGRFVGFVKNNLPIFFTRIK
ncbi:glycosyltransferase family 2 protein [Exercitatus varius]|uniref:glycosyltransferase family 2 protein n=1 Tax=Exercitatus varius TaxID=67857 RepID=UPI00294B5937|nr:glycosyltransferase family 2 protein [Exercitatus varius]MDG2943167.1 glycosyltransferase family 2 protein [Exercitatus varius]